MKKPILLLLLVTLAFGCKQETTKKEPVTTSAATTQDTELTTYYLIRHAEKDRSDPTNKDPELTPQGQLRAKSWAAFFDSIPIQQVYSTNYKRTVGTARYTAALKNLMLDMYDPSNLYSEDFQTLTEGQTVLIVGHSDTTPKFVNAIIGEKRFFDMPDYDNSTLYKVTVQNGQFKVRTFTIKPPGL